MRSRYFYEDEEESKIYDWSERVGLSSDYAKDWYYAGWSDVDEDVVEQWVRKFGSSKYDWAYRFYDFGFDVDTAKQVFDIISMYAYKKIYISKNIDEYIDKIYKFLYDFGIDIYYLIDYIDSGWIDEDIKEFEKWINKFDDFYISYKLYSSGYSPEDLSKTKTIGYVDWSFVMKEFGLSKDELNRVKLEYVVPEFALFCLYVGLDDVNMKDYSFFSLPSKENFSSYETRIISNILDSHSGKIYGDEIGYDVDKDTLYESITIVYESEEEGYRGRTVIVEYEDSLIVYVKNFLKMFISKLDYNKVREFYKKYGYAFIDNKDAVNLSDKFLGINIFVKGFDYDSINKVVDFFGKNRDLVSSNLYFDYESDRAYDVYICEVGLICVV